jgi:galactan endo-beta-1,3-galactanase
MRKLMIPALLVALVSSPWPASAVRTMIPKTSFNSQADFDADWDYLYPVSG